VRHESSDRVHASSVRLGTTDYRRKHGVVAVVCAPPAWSTMRSARRR
jgi:hypothetical protein